MSRGPWRSPGVSPFLTERARTRAPEILSYAAVSGAALLVSARGDIVMVSGAVSELDLARIARHAVALGASEGHRSFKVGTACVHALPVTTGWMLCVVSALRVHPGPILERLRRATAVMALALLDTGPPTSGGGGSTPSGAPAETVALPRPSN